MNTPLLNILIAEDQVDLAKNISDFLAPKGHVLDFAYDGMQALEFGLSNHYDLIILDIMMPKLDGLQVCKQIREKADRHIPILMLTARDTLEDKIEGFNFGADDYLTKPFALPELEMRCLALSRRHLLQTNHIIEIGELKVDRKEKSVTRGQKRIKLNSKLFQILLVLAEAYPNPVTCSELCQKLWHDDPTESDALRSHIYQLRQQLDKPFAQPMLKTMHGVGFALVSSA
ncbi:MAG: response regulator [Alteromonadaceae bacterium]|nr:response regulator [Alteromonadaceae bacterium]